jgi:hypothetical protein
MATKDKCENIKSQSKVQRKTHTEDEVVEMLNDYYNEYVAYDNEKKGYDKYWNYGQDLFQRYGFTTRCGWMYGPGVSERIRDAYHMIKLAKLDKIDKRLYSGKLTAVQANYAMFSIKSLAATDDALIDIDLRQQRLQIERDKLKLLSGDTEDKHATEITIGFGGDEDESTK